MFILRFDVESACALRDAPETEEKWQAWIEEEVAGVTQITRILNQNKAPATFFIVGQVLEKAGKRLAGLLKDNPRFDIESHT